MNKLTGVVDHLVYCVHDLEACIHLFNEIYGIEASIGGRHLSQGTKNALVNIGNGCYLELLAIDPDNDTVGRDRWMGIDLLTSNKITRWAMKSFSINSDSKVLAGYKPDLGALDKGMRQSPDGGMLRWDMTLPSSEPEVEVMPFLIDWSVSDAHPTTALSEQGQLMELHLSSPEPDKLIPYFHQLDIDIKITQGKDTTIKAIIKGPKGVFEI